MNADEFNFNLRSSAFSRGSKLSSPAVAVLLDLLRREDLLDLLGQRCVLLARGRQCFGADVADAREQRGLGGFLGVAVFGGVSVGLPVGGELVAVGLLELQAATALQGDLAELLDLLAGEIEHLGE